MEENKIPRTYIEKYPPNWDIFMDLIINETLRFKNDENRSIASILEILLLSEMIHESSVKDDIKMCMDKLRHRPYYGINQTIYNKIREIVLKMEYFKDEVLNYNKDILDKAEKTIPLNHLGKLSISDKISKEPVFLYSYEQE